MVWYGIKPSPQTRRTKSAYAVMHAVGTVSTTMHHPLVLPERLAWPLRVSEALMDGGGCVLSWGTYTPLVALTGPAAVGNWGAGRSVFLFWEAPLGLELAGTSCRPAACARVAGSTLLVEFYIEQTSKSLAGVLRHVINVVLVERSCCTSQLQAQLRGDRRCEMADSTHLSRDWDWA